MSKTAKKMSLRETIVTDALQAGDHPPWGLDWSEYLDAADLWSMVDDDECDECDECDMEDTGGGVLTCRLCGATILETAAS